MIWIACLTGFLALALGTTIASGRIRDIFDSKHDLGSPGNPTCRQCHTPHNAEAKYLWARKPAPAGSDLQSLCFSCHDGSVTTVGWYIQDPRYVNHPVQPGTPDKDCDQCHDPHQGGSWRFLRDFTPTGDQMVKNANVCTSCHKSAAGPGGLMTGTISHPVDQTINTAIDRHRDPNANPPDFQGTRLYDDAGLHVVDSGPAEVKCESCHTPHGAMQGTIPFMTTDGKTEINTLSTMPYSATKYSTICENCHD